MRPNSSMNSSSIRTIISKQFSSTALNQKKLSNWISYGLTLLLLVLFGLSDILILMGDAWPHLYGVLDVSAQRWEEVVLYMPFSQTFSLETLFPIAPVLDPTLQGSSIYPWISFLLFGLINKGIALGNPDIVLLFCDILLPILSFWLVYLVFKRYVSRSWALLLALFGITYYSGCHFADVFGCLMGTCSDDGFGFCIGLPEICRVPFPGISLLLFLIPFYLTLRDHRLTPNRLCILSILWALQIEVYVFNFLAGSIFFTFWLIWARYMTDKEVHPGKIVGSVCIFWILCILFFVQFHTAAISVVGRQLMPKLFEPTHSLLVTTDWGVLIGLSLPIGLLAITFYLFQGDFYELFHRYTPIFLAMAVDLIIGLVHLINGWHINSELYFHRISNILFRFFYFIPFFYLIGLPQKRGLQREGKLSQLLHYDIPIFLRRYVHRYRSIYTGIGVALISVYMTGSAVHTANAHERFTALAMPVIVKQIDIIKELDLPPHSIVVFQDLAANLLAPAITHYSGLLPSTFGNFVSEKDIRERILLYAKLMGYSEQRFKTFMAPDMFFQNFNSYDKKHKVVDSDQMKHGLGWWLLNHKLRLDPVELDHYMEKLSAEYCSLNIVEELQRIPVAAIVLSGPVPEPLIGFDKQVVGDFTVIRFSGANSRRKS